MNVNSPKTPGGISKSLLTPCRRVGLSRNWRKSGPSPFISPLSNSQNNSDTGQEQMPKKRKVFEDNSQTPTRNNMKNISKKLNLAKENQQDSIVNSDNEENRNILKEEKNASNATKIESKLQTNKAESLERRLIEKQNVKETSSIKTNVQNKIKSKNKSPNKLTTKCVVVLQSELINNAESNKKGPLINNTCLKPSHTVESDSDDVPLCQIKTKEDINDLSPRPHNDFDGKNNIELKVTKSQDKLTATTNLIDNSISKMKCSLKDPKTENDTNKKGKKLSQTPTLFTDDDDDDFDYKRTILIKKSYNKVIKPSKSKSTGSISDKDIRKLSERIEAKKKILLAKALGKDTEEIRSLIKKWQKGCQDALIELMELMKKKIPEEMDNTQILQMLKIPPHIIGYDTENDCFNSPDDKNIILSSLNI